MKILVRIVGGIVGKGAKGINPTYQNQFTNKQGLGTLKKIADKAKAKKLTEKAVDLPTRPTVPGLIKRPTVVTGSSVKIKNIYNSK